MALIKITEIRSASRPDKLYEIHQDTDTQRYQCTCPDFLYRRAGLGQDCKHIKEVKAEIEKANEEMGK